MHTVKRYSRYRLGNAPYQHDKGADKKFKSLEKAREYANKAPSGLGGDMSYYYEVVNNGLDNAS